VLVILTLGQLVSAFVGPVAHLLNMTGHHVMTARMQTTVAALAVVFGLIFTRILGSVGTAVAFAAAMALGNAWLTFFAARKLEIYPLPMVARCSNLLDASATTERQKSWWTR